VSPAELEAFYDSERLTQLSDIPELNNVATLSDQSIAADKLIIKSSSGNPETKPLELTVLQKDLLVFNHHMLTLDIAFDCNDLSPTPPNPEEDAARIFYSLKAFTSIRIRQRLEDTLEIPTLAATARRIIELRVNPNAVVSELAEIVESDPSLAAEVVNSRHPLITGHPEKYALCKMPSLEFLALTWQAIWRSVKPLNYPKIRLMG